MKLLVLSDLHGRRDRAREVLLLHSDADAVLFLGDGLRDIVPLTDSLGLRLEAVRGNCDIFSFGIANMVPEEQILTFGSYTVLMMHGHARSVKSGTEQATAHAARVGVDVLLYGHTHIPEETYLPSGAQVGGLVLSRPMYRLNPGSLGEPRNGRPSYGLIQIRGKDILLSHGEL